MAAATDPAAGLYMGSQLSGSQCTLMQLAAKANNLATALLQSIQILQRSWPELQLTLQPDQHYSRISFACQHAWLERPLVEASSLILQRLATYTNAGQCRPTELRLAYPEPEYGHLYAIFFACPVSFHCGVNQLLFRNYDLHQPLHPSRLTLPFSVQVEHRLERAWGYFPRVEQMATELGSVREPCGVACRMKAVIINSWWNNKGANALDYCLAMVSSVFTPSVA